MPLDYPEPVAADWPALIAIVEERVKPERMKVNRAVRRQRWWQFGDRQPALSAAISGLELVLTISRVGQQAAFAFCRRTWCTPNRPLSSPWSRIQRFVLSSPAPTKSGPDSSVRR